MSARVCFFNNWHEGADFNNAHAGAFFTPYDMAADFAIDAGQGRVIDLCAGIGVLSYFTIARSRWATEPASVTCIERNPRYVEIGKNSYRMPIGFAPMFSTGANGGTMI
ncbi:class I SAM-dependent methyltransferase [Brucella pseudogrignonensis]|uniref:hypothetical protein n=1 Tax=Brucella pseudogrignonensis TaxID=419475 RepID=UPI00194F8EE2|nr:hypothetical protein [Brucella pseudogrignonensis]